MVEFPFFNSSAEDEALRVEALRVKRMIRETVAADTNCPLINCEKRGVSACKEGCSWVLDEEQIYLGKVIMDGKGKTQ